MRSSLINLLNIFGAVFLSVTPDVRAAYEQNPFLQGENKPSPSQPETQSSDTQPPPIDKPTGTSSPRTTNGPLFTIEPPEILYGNNLGKWCLQSKGQFPSSSCNKYVNCWEGSAVEQTCPEGLLFNPAKLYCDYAGNVDCQGKPVVIIPTPAPAVGPGYVTSLNPTQTVTSSSVSSVINPSLRKFCVRSTGLFPGSTCAKFVNCWNDNAVEQDCPEGLYFSTEGYCDYPQNVDCGRQDGNDIPEKSGIQNEDCPLEFGNFRNRNDCRRYYTCAFHKVAAKYECPEGLSFSDLLGLCDYSYRVDCSKEPQIFQKDALNNVQENGLSLNAFAHTELSKLESGIQDGDCPLEFGNFRNRSDCRRYYTCAFHKVAAKYECPEGFSFSDLLGLCDYSYRVDCSKEPQIFQKDALNNVQENGLSLNAFAHPELSKPADVGDSRCTVSYGLVRDKENCSSYYVCELGKVVASYLCPQGYKFSNELGVCDQEEKVDCNNPSRTYDLNVKTMTIPNMSQDILAQVQRCVPGSVFRLNPQCTSACNCRNGVAEIIQCSSGLAYDSKLDKCIPAHLARC